MRQAGVVLWLIFLSIGIITLFWRLEWVYNQPTPVPDNYVTVPEGRHIDITSDLRPGNSRPVLLHFFNPDCPCTKFNAAQFKSMVQRYGNEVNFVLVPMSKDHYTEKDMQQFYQLNIPVVFDTSLAARCGVYSTPQAVIIDGDQRLYYRGNYNKSRYCSDKKTSYAMMALDSLLERKKHPNYNEYALTAYGCQIPVYKNQINMP